MCTWLTNCVHVCQHIVRWLLNTGVTSLSNTPLWRFVRWCGGICLSFAGGFYLARWYWCFFLKKIPLLHSVDRILCLIFSLVLGLGNACAVQLRCISLLTPVVYCGKPGRGVMKAVVLSYVIAGPITNMGLNAREVVRVFACTTRLSHNMSQTRHAKLSKPVRRALLGMTNDFEIMKDTIRSIGTVISPIQNEIEGTAEIATSTQQNDYIDDTFEHQHRSADIEQKYRITENDTQKTIYQKKYLRKLEIRCQNQFARSTAICLNMFKPVQVKCSKELPIKKGWTACKSLDEGHVCAIQNITNMDDICDSGKEIDPGLGVGYEYLKKAGVKLTKLDDIKLKEKKSLPHVVTNIQDAEQTGELVIQAFEEKTRIMDRVILVLDICLAFLFLRISAAAVTYHDLFLTDIDYDNTYVTDYFKRIDRRRRMKGKYHLLPLKKMERIKYVDVRSYSYVPTDESVLVSHILKVLLEVVTATTFVMLDRLFYEALDVVRKHAVGESVEQGIHDIDVMVEGTGILATMVRKILESFSEKSRTARDSVSNQPCLPRPRLMPGFFFFKIYGGYLWIILLLYLDPYTVRLRRLICTYFYPRREKQRILHLYNDILKKRIKMQKTLRKKAVQAVRAHYLSGENLLSLRMKFPQVLGWLRLLPAARNTCLICGETQPRNSDEQQPLLWHTCVASNCPFVYCLECWQEVGRCLACDPRLAELSDMDSLSDDDQMRH